MLNKSSRTGAERGADGEFTCAGSGAVQQQVGKVRGSAQENEPDRGEQDKQRSLRFPSHDSFMKSDDGGRAVPPLRREFLRIALSDAFDEGSPSLEAHARRQPRNGFILPVVDRVLLRIAADEWEPDLRPQRIIGLP